MSKVDDFKKFLMGTDDEIEEYDVQDYSEEGSIFENAPREQFTNDPKKTSQMVVFEPRAYSESQGIADHLKSGRGCIINLHKLSKDQAKRIIDFLSGVVYAIEGDVQKIGQNVFLCTPNNFGVYGEISEVEQ